MKKYVEWDLIACCNVVTVNRLHIPPTLPSFIDQTKYAAVFTNFKSLVTAGFVSIF